MIELYPSSGVPSPFHSGLTEELVIDVVLRGEGRRNEATALDAPARGGLDCYHERVRALREELVAPHDWTLDNDKNYCRVVSPDGLHAIAVASGTRATGHTGTQPETARPMGEATRTVVSVNEVQCSFSFVEPRVRNSLHRLTWLLLTFREGNAVRAELSLPDSITDDGVVCSWRQRYILEPQDLDARPLRDDDDPDGDDGEPIEVDVSLK